MGDSLTYLIYAAPVRWGIALISRKKGESILEFLISYLYRPLKMGDSENIPERWDLIDDWVAVLLKKILGGGA